jgi:hypothetical protein
MGNRPTLFLAPFFVAVAFSPALLGQVDSGKPAKPVESSTVRTPSDHGIVGVWYALNGNYDTASFSKGDSPMTPWGQEQFNAAKPSQVREV